MPPREHRPDHEGGDEAHKYLSIAETLRAEIDARLLGDTAGLDLDTAWDDALRAVAAPLLTEALASLPPDELLALYERHIGEDEYVSHLKQAAELIRRRNLRAARHAEIKDAAERTGMVATKVFEPQDVTRIGLYKALHVKEAFKGSSLPASRTIVVRWEDPTTGLAEVVQDSVVSATGLRESEPLQTNRLIRLGHRVIEGAAAERLRPEISAHTPLGIQDGEILSATTDIVGYVETAAGELLLNGYNKLTVK
jgi:hypothetical protein